MLPLKLEGAELFNQGFNEWGIFMSCLGLVFLWETLCFSVEKSDMGFI